MPAISVIVLVYKVERYIERCARSLFGQTMEDLEYVFVDDCSPDKSMEILDQVLQEYPQRHGQVRIIRNENNCGQAFCRRRGMEAATGDYIIHCDSDDWPEQDMYEKMYAKASSEKLDMVICGIMRVYPDGTAKPMPGATGSDDLLSSLLFQDVRHYVHNKLINRSVFRHGISYPVNNMCEDTALIIQSAYYCRSWGFLDEYLYNYSYTPGSISVAEDSMEKVEQIRANVELVFSFLESKGLKEKYAKGVMHLKCWTKFAALQLPRKYYLNLYPEANIPFFFDNRFTVVERMGHLTKILGIHGISKPFRRNR